MTATHVPAQLAAVFCAYYGAIGTPLSAELKKLAHEGKWDDIVVRRVQPRDYTDATQYFLDASAASFLRKCNDLPVSFDKRAKALAVWKEGEDACYRTNRRLRPYVIGISHPSANVDVLRHIVGIRKIVSCILGRLPSQEDMLGQFGPGATYSDPSVRSLIADKMNALPSSTSGCFRFLPNWLETKWGRECANATPWRSPVVVRGNRFATAPKDAEKDRPIGAEPSINIYYQLALGKLIRQRLKRVGIDLNSGQDTHRRVACEASITGHLATIDLSNASDTVSSSVVELLLPPEWLEILVDLRSPFTQVDGRWIKLEKFSSMGNGFTFELETLIFYAICKYTEMCLIDDESGQTLVYGDDIIVNTLCANPVIKALAFFGFSVNEGKTFVDGKFRESCGGDFFNGQAVRPFSLKELPCEPQHFIAFANGIRRKVSAHFGELGIFLRPWFSILDQLPVWVRCCRGPEGLGDIVIHDAETRFTTRSRSQRIYVKVYRPARYQKVRMSLFDPGVIHACALYGVPWSRGFLMPRDPVTGYKVGWMVLYGVNWLPEPPFGLGTSVIG